MTYRYVPPMLYRTGQFALLLEALIRGLCFIASGVPQTQTQDVAVLSAPIYAWGWLLIGFALLGASGEWIMDKGRSAHRYWPAFLGHSGLLFLYVGLAVSSLSALSYGGTSSFGSGLISPADFLLVALWHWIFARRRKHV